MKPKFGPRPGEFIGSVVAFTVVYDIWRTYAEGFARLKFHPDSGSYVEFTEDQIRGCAEVGDGWAREVVDLIERPADPSVSPNSQIL